MKYGQRGFTFGHPLAILGLQEEIIREVNHKG